MGFWSPSLPTILDEGGNVVVGAQQIDFVGAGVNVTSAVEGKATVTISGGGGSGLTPETPTGVIDDSNTFFTVVNTPQLITLNGSVQTEGEDYTYGAPTITFINPPPLGSVLRSYY